MRRRELIKWIGSAAIVSGCSDEKQPVSTRSSDQVPRVPEPIPEEPPPNQPEPLAAAPATDADWAALAEALQGRLVRPGASQYDRARRGFNPRFDDARPSGIVYTASESDVQRAIAFARAHAAPFAARCGGHSYGGYSSGPGLVCDVSPMSSVEVDVAEGTATIGAGAKLIDIYAALARYGVTIPGGSCPSVGIAGLTLGGGQGVLGRKLGLTCDALNALRSVSSDGTVHACDAQTNEDVFWASRGAGGGNFGVATRFTFRVHPVTELTRFALPWPWAAAREVIAAWQQWGPRAPDELWSKCEIGARESGESIAVHGVFMGTPAALEAPLNELIRAVGTAPRRRAVDTGPLLESMLYLGGCARRTLEECHLSPEGTLNRGAHLSRSHVFERSLSEAGIDALVEAMPREGLSKGSGRIGLDALGGAINRVPLAATAFVHRRAEFIAQYATFWGARASPTETEAGTRWLDRLHDALTPHTHGAAYQNYIDPRLSNWERAYYGTNMARLRTIKARRDPAGFFQFAQSIRGAPP